MDVLVLWLVVGAATGVLACAVAPRPLYPRNDLAGDILLGVAGAVLGGLLFERLGSSTNIAGAAVLALLGAIVSVSLQRLTRLEPPRTGR